MPTALNLKESDEFTILDDGSVLYIKVTGQQAQAPFEQDGKEVSCTPEYWIMTDDETIYIDPTITITDDNSLIYSRLIGSRPTHARQR